MIRNTISFQFFFILIIQIASKTSHHSVGKKIRSNDQNSTNLTTFPEFPDYNGIDVHTKPIVNWKHIWPNGEIFYEISNEFNKSSEHMIYDAMKEISKKTCITFKKRVNEPDYIFIQMTLGDGCYSTTGKHGGQQIINLDPRKCIQHGKIVHELLHTIGFHHEHQRPDRDKYIDILWDNIKDDSKSQFITLTAPLKYLNGFPYDCESILHYGPISFFLAKDIEEPVLKSKNYEPNMGQRIGMSELDVLKVNLLYNC